ncbi:WRKY transcription factor 19 [Phytophthora cinnamomi]|uniref:WRKY transcription factor 19 n=1 Tax=Phytophthora cinnamomi TaxID=4785 RepID=UPI003559A62F|nr:WRKY transcription factor 19 [Phytophthora cinnamomi]
MQPWSPPEKTIVLTDLLRPSVSPQNQQQQYHQQQLQQAVFVKTEPEFVVSRPGLADLPPLPPPRAPILPAITDVLRSNSPQQQPQQRYQYQYQHENQENARTVNLPSFTRSAAVPEQYSTTFSASFMTRPTNTDYRKRSGLVLPRLPHQVPYTATGDMTPPGLVGARTRPIVQREAVDPRPANRICKFAGCTHYVVDHGLCVRHGGGKRCSADGCTSRAKHFGRCWRHGGSLECKASGCSNRAKSRGYCWSHGGGTKCKTTDCDKIAISNGLCWAHGGGKRCIVPGCRKQAYERTCNYCNRHFQQYQKTALELAHHNPGA